MRNKYLGGGCLAKTFFLFFNLKIIQNRIYQVPNFIWNLFLFWEFSNSQTHIFIFNTINALFFKNEAELLEPMDETSVIKSLFYVKMKRKNSYFRKHIAPSEKKTQKIVWFSLSFEQKQF